MNNPQPSYSTTAPPKATSDTAGLLDSILDVLIPTAHAKTGGLRGIFSVSRMTSAGREDCVPDSAGSAPGSADRQGATEPKTVKL